MGPPGGVSVLWILFTKFRFSLIDGFPYTAVWCRFSLVWFELNGTWRHYCIFPLYSDFILCHRHMNPLYLCLKANQSPFSVSKNHFVISIPFFCLSRNHTFCKLPPALALFQCVLAKRGGWPAPKVSFAIIWPVAITTLSYHHSLLCISWFLLSRAGKLRKVLDIAWSFSVKIFQALIWFSSHLVNAWKFKFPLWRVGGNIFL